MSGRKVIYVSPNGDGGWNVKQQGNPSPLSHHHLKDRAIENGRREAKDADLGQLKIQKSDGRFQTEYTYGKDPHPPRG
jgi:hypothetical protein